MTKIHRCARTYAYLDRCYLSGPGFENRTMVVIKPHGVSSFRSHSRIRIS